MNCIVDKSKAIQALQTKHKIYLSPPHLSDDAVRYLNDAVASNWISPVGPHIAAFEEALAENLGVKYVLTANSGTSAIHLGLLALGVESGDEVICSTFTFCASANPIIYCNAQPVFVDSERETWNMDADLLEIAINDRMHRVGKKPKAIIIVHLYGMPANMTRIMQVADKYDIPVLEDAAEAFGSSSHGQATGTSGAAGILSFNGNKIVTTSGGGALFSNNSGIVEKARYLRQEAKEPLPYYEHKAVGYNYRMSNLLAALGCSQVKLLPDRVRRKREIFQYYVRELSGISGISFQKEPDGVESNRWLTTILVRDQPAQIEKIRCLLAEHDIESRRLWKPMHLQPVFNGFPAFCNGVSEEMFDCGLCLPSGTALENSALERVIDLIRKVFQG